MNLVERLFLYECVVTVAVLLLYVADYGDHCECVVACCVVLSMLLRCCCTSQTSAIIVSVL